MVHYNAKKSSALRSGSSRDGYFWPRFNVDPVSVAVGERKFLKLKWYPKNGSRHPGITR